MLSPGPRGVKARRALAVLLAVVVGASGCFWHRYPTRLRVHCDLLVAYARKARDLVHAGLFSAETLPELVYPLERATAFAADARRRTDDPPPSLAAFDTLLARYRALVDLVDRTRREPPTAESTRALDDAVHAVEEAAAATLTADQSSRRS